MKTKSRKVLLTVVSLIILVLVGLLLYQKYGQANVDITCYKTQIEQESIAGSCGGGSWGPWESIGDNKEERTYTGNVLIQQYELSTIPDQYDFGLHSLSESAEFASGEKVRNWIRRNGYSCDVGAWNYPGAEDGIGALQRDSEGYLVYRKKDDNGDFVLDANGDHVWVRYEPIEAEPTYKQGFGLQDKGGVMVSESAQVCQMVETRVLGGCNRVFYPATEEVCEGTNFTQNNSCGDSQQATGTKTCEVCEPGAETVWLPSPTEYCAGDSFTQYSSGDCPGNVRVSVGTKECGEVIIPKCENRFGNMVPGVDSDGDGKCDVYEPAEIDLEMECSTDEENWLDCEAHVWQLTHPGVPIYIKLVPEGEACSEALVKPVFSYSSPEPGQKTSLKFGEVSERQNGFVTETLTDGELNTEVFTKKVKAEYCGENGMVEKELKIKILDVRIRED